MMNTSDLFKNSINGGIIIEGELLKKSQNIILSIAADIMCICDENNLICTLGGGSVLGAIRHNGFIPWDDDIDLNMPRDDYEKLLKIIKEKYSKKYWVHTPWETDNYGLLFAQIRMKGTKYRGRDDFLGDEAGVFVDIFPVENTYNKKLLRNIHGTISMALCFIVSCKKFCDNHDHIKNFAWNNKTLLKKINKKAFIGKFFGFFSLNRWVHIADTWNKQVSDKTTKFVVIPSGRRHYFGEIYERNIMLQTKKNCFEEYQFNIPIGYEDYLKKLYGNYMQLPPIEKREKHVLIELDI